MQEIKDLTAYRLSLKDKILDTAIAAFTRKGVKAVRMDDIAKSISISKRTLYEIYGDKEKLLIACVQKSHKERQQYMKAFSDTHNVIEVVIEVYRNNIIYLKEVNHMLYEDIRRYPNVMRFMEDEHNKGQKNFVEFMKRGVEEGYFRPQVNYELVARLFDAIGEHIKRERLYTQYSYEELFANMLLVPFRGFCTDEGIKILNASDL